MAVVHPDGGLPEGQTFHVAGPADGGFLIAAVWESEEHAARFVQEKLSQPIEGGLVGLPEERTAEVTHTVG